MKESKKIIDLINEKIQKKEIFHSMEYFPPKTAKGEKNLYSRIERMANLNPLFVDITWGAGGSTAGKTLEIARVCQQHLNLQTQIHMTCTNMDVSKIDEALEKAKEYGIRNILCLRGDPPGALEKGEDKEWKKTEGGFQYAKDLVAYIRKKYGDYFGLAVAGYPEGHPDGSYEKDLKYLKEKIDAGADLVVTQLFYDVDQFIKFTKDAKKIGITCPILPGIMPIHNHKSWTRMIGFCKTNIPESLKEEMSKINLEDDSEVKKYGIELCSRICKKLGEEGHVPGYHLYTLNLEKSVTRILEALQMLPETVRKELPWITENAKKRSKEEVRPIFWSNRPKSYIERTSSWDEFPNGRWGHGESPAFGSLTDYNIVSVYDCGSPQERRKIWREALNSVKDVHGVFVDYLKGNISSLPWCYKKVDNETSLISKNLVSLNEKGYLTINSQPAVNGTKSDDKKVGWGPKGGYVYQKAYVEFFCSEENMKALFEKVKNSTSISFQSVNLAGKTFLNGPKSSTAVTWGVFPNSEVKQPTIADNETFLVWKDEAFKLWEKQWLPIYEKGSESSKIIQNIIDNWYLVNIIDNDYVGGNIFKIFE